MTHVNGPSKKKLSVYQQDSSPVLGIIERVRLENLMCHSEFEWSPNPCVNFVTGANGSGKSSVLQGESSADRKPVLRSRPLLSALATATNLKIK